MKKFLSLALSAVMLVTLLTGCMAEVGEITINEDGSGTVKMMVGYTQEAIDSYIEAEGGYAGITEQVEQFQKFEYNGTTYYGEIIEDTFSSLDEISDSDTDISDIFNDDPRGIQILPIPDEYGKFRVIFATETSEDIEDELANELINYDDELSYEDVQQLLSTMVVVLKITLPSEVRQLQGDTKGITLKGNTIEVNMIELSKAEGQFHGYEFTNSMTAEPSNIDITDGKKQTFSDVNPESWYYEAIEFMASTGIVSGVGDGKFNPNGNITYAQFCQIVSNTVNFETGAKDEYWAYKAINSCLQNGIIGNRGDINSSNYDVAMQRDAAVAGIYRMFIGYNTDMLPSSRLDIEAKDIPDYDKIGDAYKGDIVQAYKCGITTGVDSNGTFSPESILTRAQVCQLIYNMLGK